MHLLQSNTGHAVWLLQNNTSLCNLSKKLFEVSHGIKSYVFHRFRPFHFIFSKHLSLLENRYQRAGHRSSAGTL